MSAAHSAPSGTGHVDAPAAPRFARRALAGFFVSGLLFSFPGAILPVWQAQLTQDFTEVGKYFFAMGLGLVAGLRMASGWSPWRSVRFWLTVGSSLGLAAFILLAFASPPAPALWRLAGLFLAGMGASLLNNGLFEAVSPLYQRDRAATLNLAGAIFGLGCFVTALMVSQTFYLLRGPGVPLLLAAGPALGLWLFQRTDYPSMPFSAPARRQTLRDLQTPITILLSLLMFFQFASEWSIAGWLPLFLIRRLGASPQTAILMLACFWLVLFSGRIIAQSTLDRLHHGRLLGLSVLVELFGYFLLSQTDNLSGATVGIVCLGAGYSVTYPLVAEKIGHRFSDDHPFRLRGIFWLSMSGALLAPWLLGYFAEAWGIGSVLALPFLGTLAACFLLLLILLEAYLSGLRRGTREA